MKYTKNITILKHLNPNFVTGLYDAFSTKNKYTTIIKPKNPYFVTGLSKSSSINKFIRQFSTKSSNTNNTNLSLVVWGTNLTSQVGTGRFTKQVSEMVKLPPYQDSVIVGLILSDAWLRLSNKRSTNALLGFQQSLARSDYVWFVFSIISHYCNIITRLNSGIKAGKRFYGLQLETRALPCFTELYSLFYVNGVKVIPENIYELLTPVALAHVIMGDGSAQRHGLILCTDSYTIPEVVCLINVLMIRYRLDCTVRFHTSSQPRIYIKQRSMAKLQTIVGPWMLPSLLYKIGK